MRLGIDVGRALHGAGGVASYTAELARGLVAHLPADPPVLFDLDRGEERRSRFERVLGPLPDGVEIVGRQAENLRSLHLIHAPGFRMPPLGVGRCALTVHDLTVISDPRWHTVRNRARTLVALAEALSRGATLVAVSEATAREIQRLLDVSASRVAVVPPIIGAEFAPRPAADDDAVVSRLVGDGPYVLSVASLEPRKNLDRLLDAWSHLSGSLAGRHRLVVVASAAWRSGPLRRRLRALQGGGDVKLLAHVSRAELATLYRRSRALVYPSLAEGFGLPVAEAMACGTAVVTSDRSSMPEVAGDGALLVDPEDVESLVAALERVLVDADLRRELRQRGIERAGRFSAAAVIPQLVHVYRSACGLLG